MDKDLSELTKYLDKKFKDTNARIDQQRQEYQRYLGALVEDFNSKLKLMAESLSAMIGKNAEMIAKNSEMIAKNSEDLEVIKMDTGIIKSGLKRKVDIEEFETLEKRVRLLEKKR